MRNAASELLEKSIKSIEPEIRDIIEKSLSEDSLSIKDGIKLMQVNGMELQCLLMAADLIRQRKVGNVVTYVFNRNINFTNQCTIRCKFCAYSTSPSSKDGMFLSMNDIQKKAREARDIGATELCVQGGIAPNVNLDLYIQIIQAIKSIAPEIHLHAFSPMEVFTGARRSGVSIKEALQRLRDEGLDSIPGTAAEILVDDVRKKICPNKISVQSWIKVITNAHELGIPTTATMLYGHVESAEDRVKHLKILRDIQEKTGGFTEFIPLAFININGKLSLPPNLHGDVSNPIDHLKILAVSRLFLHNFRNIQVSWVKLGPRLAQQGLNAGANDFGGTLMEENISRSAGASHGEYLEVSQIRTLIKEIHRIPIQRSTTYEYLQEIPAASKL
ncbi:MAG: 5-amino-6-(D-ribitylamino)uracil--L-tyrosine 4-hydroxyphenyl transferase CofH [Candidatus Helarchaeales archaeon]